tara:strand:- start:244 stop:492 length:249 start_codon:yes stop_codon:yes gene_type:complete
MAINNPTPEQMTDMIEAIFAKTDDLLINNDLSPPSDRIGFTELLRLVFDDDNAGRAIFNSFDEKLLETLWQMYRKRPKNEKN